MSVDIAMETDVVFHVNRVRTITVTTMVLMSFPVHLRSRLRSPWKQKPGKMQVSVVLPVPAGVTVTITMVTSANL